VRRLELRRSGAELAEGADELAFLREARDASDGAGRRVRLLAGMAFGDERSPLAATTMLQGSVSAPSCGLPATPGLPIVISTLPFGSNLTTVWPAGPALGFLACSLLFMLRMSTTHTLPSRSW
jgi:hypothetical protein